MNRSGLGASRLPRFMWLRDFNLGSSRYRSTWLKRGTLSEMVGSLTAIESGESLVLGALTTTQGFVEVFTHKDKFKVTCQAEVGVGVGEGEVEVLPPELLPLSLAMHQSPMEW